MPPSADAKPESSWQSRRTRRVDLLAGERPIVDMKVISFSQSRGPRASEQAAVGSADLRRRRHPRLRPRRLRRHRPHFRRILAEPRPGWRWPSARSRPGCAPRSSSRSSVIGPCGRSCRHGCGARVAGGAGREPGPGGGPGAHAGVGRGPGAGASGWAVVPVAMRLDGAKGRWELVELQYRPSVGLAQAKQGRPARPRPLPTWPRLIHRPCAQGCRRSRTGYRQAMTRTERLVLQPHLLFASLVVCAAGAGLVAAWPS